MSRLQDALRCDTLWWDVSQPTVYSYAYSTTQRSIGWSLVEVQTLQSELPVDRAAEMVSYL
jgi:hypothetical protein